MALRIELFPRDAFPDILQDVLVVSGTKSPDVRERQPVTFCQRSAQSLQEWQHDVSDRGTSWTQYLLSSAELEAFSSAQSLVEFFPWEKSQR